MSKGFKIFGCILLIAVSGAVTFSLFYSIFIAPSLFLVSHSPTGIYRVELEGGHRRPLFFLTATVDYRVFKNGERFWTETQLHSGDVFDLSFDMAFPSHEWISSDAIRFFRPDDSSGHPPHLITLENDTDRPVKQLKIESLDKFLLFDMPPRSQVILSASPPKGNYPGIKVSGGFEDGQMFQQNATFRLRSMSDPLSCNVKITDNNVIIESQYIEK